MEKRKILFVINQLFKGGAETALLNLLYTLPRARYEIDLLIFDQIDLPNTISLIPSVPSWINVINVTEGEGKRAFFKKAVHKIYRKLTKRQIFRKNAVHYVHGQKYDVAISFGEWFSSALVAKKVEAARKYIWIHADIDKAAFLHPDVLKYHMFFDKFIFVSEHSKCAALDKYPVLRGRTTVVYNLVNQETIKRMGEEQVNISCHGDLPIVVTVANIRPEKNHLRQVNVMKRVKEMGAAFLWLNIGSTANVEQTAVLKAAIKKAGLQDEFLLLGAIENPYPYIKAASAVCVLSDHESWSMVITEAKTLGIPVIATKTSGALSQIVTGETGVLCEFTDEDIAQRLYQYLTEPEIGKRIRGNLAQYSSETETMGQLEPLLLNDRRKVLYVFDDINYTSGARNAALNQIKCISQAAEVTVFSAEPCRDKAIAAEYPVIDLADNRAFRCLSEPAREVISSPNNGKKIKLIRLLYAVLARMHADHILFDWLLKCETKEFMESFDTVCVVSEASKLRNLVSTLKNPKKIQWIHTDYAAWRELNSWTRAITKRDSIIYSEFDNIVCLSPRLKNKFDAIYPHLTDKTVVIPNLIDYERILRMAEEPLTFPLDDKCLNLITVGRMEAEKRYDRLLEIAAELKKQGADFHWYFVGGGNLLEEMKQLCGDMELTECIVFTGALQNPYPLMKQCDLFVLLSDYEGTPVTIDEAKVLGLSVLANDVGGIADMLEGTGQRILLHCSQQTVAQEILNTKKKHSIESLQPNYKRFNQNVSNLLKTMISI